MIINIHFYLHLRLEADFAAAQVSPHVTSTQPAPVMGTPLSNLQPAMAQIPIVVPISVDERPQQQQPIDEGAGDAPSENIYPDEPIPDDPQEVVPEPGRLRTSKKNKDCFFSFYLLHLFIT